LIEYKKPDPLLWQELGDASEMFRIHDLFVRFTVQHPIRATRAIQATQASQASQGTQGTQASQGTQGTQAIQASSLDRAVQEIQFSDLRFVSYVPFIRDLMAKYFIYGEQPFSFTARIDAAGRIVGVRLLMPKGSGGDSGWHVPKVVFP